MYKVNHKVIHSVPNSAAFLGVEYWGTFLEKNYFTFSECDFTEKALLSLRNETLIS